MTLDIDPLSPGGGGDTPRDESPPESFGQLVARQANERLTELDARATGIAGQIEALRLEMDTIQRAKAEAQRILAAAVGEDGELATASELQFSRKVGEPQGATNGAAAPESPEQIGGPPADWTGGTWPPVESRLTLPVTESSDDALDEAERQVREREVEVTPDGEREDEPSTEQPDDESKADWPGGKWAGDEQRERTAAVMDEAARDWLATNRPSASFTVANLKAALDVTRPTASGIVDRLQQAGVIKEIDGGRAFVLVTEEEIRPVEEAALEAAGVEEDNAVTVEPESPPKPAARSAIQTGGRRANNQVVTLEEVRDAAVKMPGKFNMKELGEAMGHKPPTISRYVRTLHEQGVLVRHGGIKGPGVKYEHVKPDPRSGPRERPRHDGPRQLPKGTTAVAPQRGVAVAHTGRPVGRSGRPGADRKKAQLGFRVKDRKKK